MSRVAINHLSKAFRRPQGPPVSAVQEVSLNVPDGELLALVGPSGCGKTTLLRLIAGLEEITQGTVAIDGQPMNGVPPQDRDVAMVFQHPALYPHLTVFENLAFGLKLRHVPRPEIERRVCEAAEWLGIAPCLDRRPATLSGGERQRVALGRALVRRPKVFLLDEPLSNLDGSLRTQLRAEIARLHAHLGATMIYVTHDQLEAMTLGRRVAVMKAGVIQQVAAPMELYDRPANLFVAGFIGSPPMNLFRGAILEERGRLCFVARGEFTVAVPPAQTTELARHPGREVVLGVRPEHIRFSPDVPAPASGVMATVELLEPTGAEVCVHLKAGGLAFVARVPAPVQVELNQCVTVEFDLNRARLFDPQSERALAGEPA